MPGARRAAQHSTTRSGSATSATHSTPPAACMQRCEHPLTTAPAGLRECMHLRSRWQRPVSSAAEGGQRRQRAAAIAAAARHLLPCDAAVVEHQGPQVGELWRGRVLGGRQLQPVGCEVDGPQAGQLLQTGAPASRACRCCARNCTAASSPPAHAPGWGQRERTRAARRSCPPTCTSAATWPQSCSRLSVRSSSARFGSTPWSSLLAVCGRSEVGLPPELAAVVAMLWLAAAGGRRARGPQGASGGSRAGLHAMRAPAALHQHPPRCGSRPPTPLGRS